MEIRGQRECQDCGRQWSYYETGAIECPECGSRFSLGVGDPAEHTTGGVDLDLSEAIDAVDTVPIRVVADLAVEAVSEYLRRVGFVNAGELEPLSDETLAAFELRRVGATVGRLMDPSEDEELYFLDLMRGVTADERPPPSTVLDTFAPERGLAASAATEAYVSDLRRVVSERPTALDRTLSTIATRRKRIEALDGAVDPAETERLVDAVRDVSAFVRTGDETALERARERFEQ